jgi:hypothetical protein
MIQSNPSPLTRQNVRAGVKVGIKTSLEEIRVRASGRSYRWGIQESSPLCTRASRGYELGEGGRHPVFAEITSTWEIEPLGAHNPGARLHRKFALTGIASTRVRLFREDVDGNHEDLAMWRMEIADEASPGCYFHVQVLGDKDGAPFPRFLSIPRLPSFFATPPFVLEFVLGELFQDEWRKEAVKESNSLKMWRPIQSKRLANLLGWQRDKLRGALGSP